MHEKLGNESMKPSDLLPRHTTDILHHHQRHAMTMKCQFVQQQFSSCSNSFPSTAQRQHPMSPNTPVGNAATSARAKKCNAILQHRALALMAALKVTMLERIPAEHPDGWGARSTHYMRWDLICVECTNDIHQ